MRFGLLALVALTSTASIAQFAPTGRPPVERPLNPIAAGGRMQAPATWREVRDIRDRIDKARSTGALSRREARRADREALQTGELAARYSVGGLSAAEARELEVRTRVLRETVDARRTQGGRR